MEFNNRYGNSPFYDNQQPRRRSLGGFGIAVIVLLTILVAAIVLAVSLRGEYRNDMGVSIEPERTAAPEPTKKPAAAPATPVPGTGIMPPLDGVAPDLSDIATPGFWDNPIPSIFDAVSPSVVGVINYTTQTFGKREILDIYGSGSGFVISSEGYILTNAHVVADAEKITVLLDSGEEVEAALIGADNETDVAVLRVDRRDLVPLAVGNSDDMRVGEFVIAIGNPLDSERLANTTTFGVISAKAREITIDGHTNTYLQTDAAINFGNSGGPLLNMRGEVIGMNSAKSITAGFDEYGNAVSAEGIGFALPINAVCTIMERLITEGSIERPAVGITVYTLTEAVAAEMELPLSSGIYVASVVTDGPASRAGVCAGDIILSANGRTITEQAELIAVINECSVGDSIRLEIFRNGDTFYCDILLADKNQMDFNTIDPLPAD